jgi:hypothetical protein
VAPPLLYRKSDADRWVFAVAPSRSLEQLAPRLDLLVSREPGGSISHNLRTVLLDPFGRRVRQFDGNKWNPKGLADAARAAAEVPE